MGLFKVPKLEENQGDPIPQAAGATGAIPKSTSPKQRPSWADFASPDKAEGKPSSVKHMAELVGLSPTQITKQARTNLVGDLVKQALSPPMPKLAEQNIQPAGAIGPDNVGGASGLPTHAKTSTEIRKEREERKERLAKASPNTRRRMQKESLAQLKKEIEEAKAAKPAQRPTRSVFKAPDIPHTPSVSLERSIKKELKPKPKPEPPSDSELD